MRDGLIESDEINVESNGAPSAAANGKVA